MPCRFFTFSGCNKEDITKVGNCSLGSSSIKPKCSGGNDETKCGQAKAVIIELERLKILGNGGK